MDQLDFLRDYQYPLRLNSYTQRLQALQKFSAQSAENERQAQSDVFGLQNSFKAVTGYQAGLKDKELMAKKAAEEKSLQQFVSSDPQRQQEFGDPWAADRQSGRGAEANSTNRCSILTCWAASAATWRVTPATSCGPQRKSNCPATSVSADIRTRSCPPWSSGLFSDAPIYKPLEQVELAESLAEMHSVLGADNAEVQKALDGKSPDARAQELIAGTKLDQVAVRKQLYEGGQAAVDASTDPLIVTDAPDRSRRARRTQSG